MPHEASWDSVREKRRIRKLFMRSRLILERKVAELSKDPGSSAAMLEVVMKSLSRLHDLLVEIDKADREERRLALEEAARKDVVLPFAQTPTPPSVVQPEESPPPLKLPFPVTPMIAKVYDG